MIFRGVVISGMGIGSRIGFPTVNLKVSDLEIEHGVYAVMARALDPEYRQLGWTEALMHYGPKPTFGVEQIYCEIHFLDYSIEGAPRELEIEVKGYIRGVFKFDGPESLVAQMERDREFAQEHFFQKSEKSSKKFYLRSLL